MMGKGKRNQRQSQQNNCPHRSAPCTPQLIRNDTHNFEALAEISAWRKRHAVSAANPAATMACIAWCARQTFTSLMFPNARNRLRQGAAVRIAVMT
jgi:hypothetical protein